MLPESFDQAIRSKLDNWSAPVQEEQWTNLQESLQWQNKLQDHVADVPAGMWERLSPQLSAPALPDADKIIRDKLYHSIAPVREEVWENIEAEKEKKRRVVFWWTRSARVAAALLLFLSGALVAAYYYMEKSAPLAQQNAPSAIQGQSGLAKGSTQAAQAALPPPDGSAPIQTEAESQPESETKPTVAGPIQLAAPENALGSAKVYHQKTNRQKDNLWGEQSNNAKGPFTQNAYGSLSTNNGFNPKGSNEDLLPVAASHASETDASTEEVYRLSPKSGWALWRPTGASLQPTAPLNLTDAQHANKIKNVVICPTDRKNRNTDWDLEVFAGPGLGLKTVSSNGASNAFLQSKDSAESGSIGYTVGARLVKPLNDHFSLKTGLTFTQHNEKFVYRTENQIKTTTVVTVRTIIRGPGDTLRVNDTSIVQQAGFINSTVKNRFRSIDIPLLASYRWGNDDFSIGIQGGLVFNLSSWYEGVMYDSSLAPVALNKQGGLLYKNKLGWGLMAGLQVSKKIGYSAHVFAEPFFRYHFNNMTQPGAAYQQKINFGGLSVGLRFNLNNR